MFSAIGHTLAEPDNVQRPARGTAQVQQRERPPHCSCMPAQSCTAPTSATALPAATNSWHVCAWSLTVLCSAEGPLLPPVPSPCALGGPAGPLAITTTLLTTLFL